jgi:pimeloyl-ACP methyl ester carboxylesterase
MPLVDDKAHLIAVDLLGFGGSPKPSWPDYSLDDHTRSIRKTLRRYFWRRPVILVGHSLGCLVAIEFARRWPHMVDRLILCSPPFYTPSQRPLRQLPKRDDIYMRAYAAARTYRIGALAVQYLGREAAGAGFMVDETTWPAFMKTLQSSIEEQQSYEHAVELDKPIDIIYGRFDTFLIEKRIKSVAKANSRITLHKINAAHSINKKYAAFIAKVINTEHR